MFSFLIFIVETHLFVNLESLVTKSPCLREVEKPLWTEAWQTASLSTLAR